MIYYYDIAIKYTIGGKNFIKVYKKCFTEICDFFIWLKHEHKDNFTIVGIKEHKQYGIKPKEIYYEEFTINKGSEE